MFLSQTTSGSLNNRDCSFYCSGFDLLHRLLPRIRDAHTQFDAFLRGQRFFPFDACSHTDHRSVVPKQNEVSDFKSIPYRCHKPNVHGL